METLTMRTFWQHCGSAKTTGFWEFVNYDVYNSSAIAENAVIFERGGYVVMLMLEDNDSARRIVERYIPEKLNLS